MSQSVGDGTMAGPAEGISRGHGHTRQDIPMGSLSIDGYDFIPGRPSDVIRPVRLSYQSLLSEHGSGADDLCELPQVEHLDKVKTWVDLTRSKAKELVFWGNMFRMALENHLRYGIRLLHQERSSLSAEQSFRRFMNDAAIQIFSVDALHIARAMLDLAIQTGLGGYEWFTQSWPILDNVLRFVLTHDCFFPAHFAVPSSHILVRIIWPRGLLETSSDLARPGPKLHTMANADRLDFEAGFHVATEGEAVFLRPRYLSPSRIATDYARRAKLAVTFESPATWLRWSDRRKALVGTMPSFSDLQHGASLGVVELVAPNPAQGDISTFTVRIIIEGKAWHRFPAHVYRLHTVRVKVTFTVKRRSPLQVPHGLGHGVVHAAQPSASSNHGRPLLSPAPAPRGIPQQRPWGGLSHTGETSPLPESGLSCDQWPHEIYRPSHHGLLEMQSALPVSNLLHARSITDAGHRSNALNGSISTISGGVVRPSLYSHEGLASKGGHSPGKRRAKSSFQSPSKRQET